MVDMTPSRARGSRTVAEAAALLGVTANRVRSLIASGNLPAERRGRILLIPAEAVEARRALEASGGRIFTQANAWAVLFIASGLPAPWLDRRDRFRLRRHLAAHSLEALRARLASRARVESLRAHPGLLARLREEPALALTGASASPALALGLVGGPDIIDAYVRAADADVLRQRYSLRPSPEPNVRLRLVSDDLPAALRQGGAAPLAAVAIDLLEDPEPRLQQVGRAAMSRLPR